MTREQAREAAEVMLAFADGKTVQYWIHGYEGWGISTDPSFDWKHCTFRVKEESKFRPWAADEVPLGAWIRSKQGPTRGFGHGIIIYADDGGVPMPCGIQNSWVGFHDLLNNFEHSTDNGKTWKPCGMEE